MSTVTEIKVDTSMYPAESNYTLTSVVLCVNATFDIGIENLQLRLSAKGAGFTILKMYNYGGGETFRACFSDDAENAIQKGAEILGGTWKRHSPTSIESLISPFAGSSVVSSISVKNHHSSLIGAGAISWSIETCFDGWEAHHAEWQDEENERIAKRDEYAALPWCEEKSGETGTPTLPSTLNPTTAAPEATSAPSTPSTLNPTTAAPR